MAPAQFPWIGAVSCGWGAAWIWLALAAGAPGQVDLPRPFYADPNKVYSRSQQFFISAAPAGTLASPYARRFQAPTNAVTLEPAVLSVTSERVKDALLQELGAKDEWRGRIQIALEPATAANTEIIIKALQFSDGWRYRVEMPDRLAPERLVRALVQVLLQEMANRADPQRQAEIPLWLTEGLTAQILAIHNEGLVLEPRTRVSFSQRRLDPLQEVRTQLRQQSALSFADLNLPGEASLNGGGWETYRRSAQLLLVELQGLRNGRAALQAFIRELPHYLNAQLAFLEAFRAHFETTLAVEKWWSVTLVHFTGRALQMKWAAATCLQRLDEILRAPVEVRAGADALPRRDELHLQRLLEQADYAHQKPALQQAVVQLTLLQANAPPDVRKLVKDYSQTLTGYLQHRERAMNIADQKGQAGGARLIVRNTIEQLDLLDVIRGDFAKYGGTNRPTAIEGNVKPAGSNP